MKTIIKKIILLFALIIFVNRIVSAQAPDWLWAKNEDGTSHTIANSITTDSSGNVYMTGNFGSSTVTFGSTILTNVGGYDIFLVKYNADGDVTWAKNAGGSQNDYANSVAVDGSGNIYITGNFHGPSIYFDTTILANAGSADIFLAKYNSLGDVLWAKRIGGTEYEYATCVTADASGNAYLSGYFGSPTLFFGTNIITNTLAVYYDAFLAKYDANGNSLWAKSAGGTDYDYANSVAVDVNGNVFLTGYFRSLTISFDSTTLTNADNAPPNTHPDIFLAKYNANGNLLWAKSAGQTDLEIATSVSVDTSGNVYMAGYFEGATLSFSSTVLINTSSMGNSCDLFIAKYNSSGNVIWAKSAEGMDNDYMSNIATDAFGNSFVTGSFDSQTLTFGTSTLTNPGSYYGSADLFIAKFNTNGNVQWAKSAGGIYDDGASSVVVDGSGNNYLAGVFCSPTITFGNIVLANTDTSGNSGTFYLAKLGKSSEIDELGNSLNISVFPNPTTNNLTIESPTKTEVEILNTQGQIIKRFKIKDNKITIDISGFARGMYFVKVKNERGIAVKKFIKE